MPDPSLPLLGQRDSRNMREISGRWVPAIPLRAPIDVRWNCSHRWTPHVHDSGETSHVDYDCTRCGAATEAGAWPEDGPYRLRAWIARKLWKRGVAHA